MTPVEDVAALNAESVYGKKHKGYYNFGQQLSRPEFISSTGVSLNEQRLASDGSLPALLKNRIRNISFDKMTSRDESNRR